ncbi:unnamed protein product [Cyclocybe aegerita]|uniref:Uncharacterized protein n=1 Tax=Cyclocybe aegerita TaxID=1973307 RepID=A0A8S0VV92_CYCAE|nr:unnamed protein product [Cyclocybe aegerita]
MNSSTPPRGEPENREVDACGPDLTLDIATLVRVPSLNTPSFCQHDHAPMVIHRFTGTPLLHWHATNSLAPRRFTGTAPTHNALPWHDTEHPPRHGDSIAPGLECQPSHMFHGVI